MSLSFSLFSLTKAFCQSELGDGHMTWYLKKGACVKYFHQDMLGNDFKLNVPKRCVTNGMVLSLCKLVLRHEHDYELPSKIDQSFLSLFFMWYWALYDLDGF